MDEKVLQELRIANLLKVLEMEGNMNITKLEQRKKILQYIFDREMTELQFDVALFPKEKSETQNYDFFEKRFLDKK